MIVYKFFSVEDLGKQWFKEISRFKNNLFPPLNYATLVYNVNKISLSIKHTLMYKKQSINLGSQMFGERKKRQHINEHFSNGSSKNYTSHALQYPRFSLFTCSSMPGGPSWRFRFWRSTEEQKLSVFKFP